MNPNSNQFFQPQGGAPQPPVPPNNPYGPGAPTGAPTSQPQFGHSAYKASKPIGWIIATVLLALLLAGAGGFGYWAFAEREDYKNNVDQKIAAAVDEAVKQNTEENNQRFEEEYKKPLKQYKGPSALGSIQLSYPKTWSGFIDQTNQGNSQFTARFHPDTVPAITGDPQSDRPIAFTIAVLNDPYDRVIAEREHPVSVGDLRATPYALSKMKDEVGMKFVGKINQHINGTEIVIPLRDKTLLITSQTDQFIKDVNNHILPNLTFVP